MGGQKSMGRKRVREKGGQIVLGGEDEGWSTQHCEGK